MAIKDQLKKHERYFRLIVETTNYNLTVIDPVTLMHSYVNPSVSDLLGYSPEEFIEIPFLEILVPSQSEG